MPRGLGGYSPDTLRHKLQALDFPAGKARILDYADEALLDEDLVQALQAIPNRDYADEEDVLAEVAGLY